MIPKPGLSQTQTRPKRDPNETLTRPKPEPNETQVLPCKPLNIIKNHAIVSDPLSALNCIKFKIIAQPRTTIKPIAP